jgi:hypothetical protein
MSAPFCAELLTTATEFPLLRFELDFCLFTTNCEVVPNASEAGRLSAVDIATVEEEYKASRLERKLKGSICVVSLQSEYMSTV